METGTFYRSLEIVEMTVQKLFVSASFYLFWELFSARASLVEISLTRLELESFHGFRLRGFGKW